MLDKLPICPTGPRSGRAPVNSLPADDGHLHLPGLVEQHEVGVRAGEELAFVAGQAEGARRNFGGADRRIGGRRRRRG
ncbi:MAG: hypothetical protein FD146_1661 [Anaerolineaceae bacterium]|nr:MAG: hypothetical protein FD146_1661 [Anaerolineaceae bacterium]